MTATECSKDECSGKVRARGLCATHYEQGRREGFAERVRPGPQPQQRPCSKDGCEVPRKSYGLCREHLRQARAAGELAEVYGQCSFAGCGKPNQRAGLCEGHAGQARRGLPLSPLRAREARPDACRMGDGREVLARGLCSSHYAQQQRGEEVRPVKEYAERGVPCAVAECGRPSQSEGLCPTHYRRRLDGDEDWARPIPAKAPSGTGHVDKDGYRLVQHEGRQVREHRLMAAQLLGRPLLDTEQVHHVDGQRARNVVDGPFRLDDRGRLRSGNLEVWSTSQPAGQEVGPKVEWAAELLRLYAPHLLAEGA